MRFKLFVLIITIAFIPMVAQDKVASYSNSFWNETYDIEVSTKNNGEIKDVYVGVHAKSKRSASVSFGFKNLEKFLLSLKQMKAKFVEWSQVAKDNNVTGIDKSFDIKFPNVDVEWLGTKWWFSFGVKLTFTFRVTDKGNCLAFCSPKVTASSNRFIDETIFFTFASEEDFDQLIDALNADNLIAGSKAKEKQQDLFR